MRVLKLLVLGGGAVAIAGAVVVGFLISRGSATVEVTNVDCGPIAVPTDVAGEIIRQLPGIELPSEPIDSGTTAVVRVPAGTYEVELRSDQILVAWLGVVVEQPLPEPARSVIFEDRELLGAGRLRFDLADGGRYRLRLVCAS